MALTRDKKEKIIEEFAVHKGDTGSPEVQIALLTFRINALADHFKKHPHDFASKRGFIKLVSRRKKLLSYLKGLDEKRYQALIKRLGLRK